MAVLFKSTAIFMIKGAAAYVFLNNLVLQSITFAI